MAWRENDGDGFTIKGRHVLFGMVAFFAIIFAVNGVFLYQALSTHTGLISEQPYVKGLGYNDRIAAEKAQQRRGWREKIELSPDRNRLSFKLQDRDGRPVAGLAVAGFVGRPSTRDLDVSLQFSETDAGMYEVAFEPLAAGNWMVELEARQLNTDNEQVVYRLRKRLWLKR